MEEVQKLKEDFEKVKSGLLTQLTNLPQTLEKHKEIVQKTILLTHKHQKLSEEHTVKGGEASAELVATCMELLCNYGALVKIRQESKKLSGISGAVGLHQLKCQLEGEMEKMTVVEAYVAEAGIAGASSPEDSDKEPDFSINSRNGSLFE
ncbi:hypothetical protein DMENIID0001_041010 [Sergentomyia squamirostris]